MTHPMSHSEVAGRDGACEVSSVSGSHLRGRIAASSLPATPLPPASRPSPTSSSIVANLAGQPEIFKGCNWAQLAVPDGGGADFGVHPGVGDCTIHLGAVPAAGQPLLHTR